VSTSISGAPAASWNAGCDASPSGCDSARPTNTKLRKPCWIRSGIGPNRDRSWRICATFELVELDMPAKSTPHGAMLRARSSSVEKPLACVRLPSSPWP
jgi:hypothetical protein